MQKRNRLVLSTVHPYHLVARVNNRETFPLPLKEVWDVLTRELLVASWVHQARVHALVLMPNHFHLLMTSPTRPMGDLMRDLMSYLTRELNVRSGRKDRIFGARYYPSLIDQEGYLWNATKYIYRNPVKAGLVERVEEWRYSTLRGIIGLSSSPFPIFLPNGGLGERWGENSSEDLLKWLNSAPSAQISDAIQRGLRRPVFQPPRVRSTRKRIELEA